MFWACCAVAKATLAKSPPESQACNVEEASAFRQMHRLQFEKHFAHKESETA